MKTKKYTNTTNLQKSSGLFLQLGLVLTLFIVYQALELKTEVKTAMLIDNSSDTEIPYEFENLKDFVVEPKAIVKKVKPVVKVVKPTDFVTTTNPIPNDAPPFEPTDPDEGNPTPTVVTNRPPVVDVNVTEDFIDDIKTIDKAPIFPGCEKAKYKDKKACFENKLRKFVSRKFNTSLAPQLGLTSGVKRIFVEFVITKTGEVNVKQISAPNKRLEKEGERVVNKLPKMIPGKKAGKEVNMIYKLPIIFEVQ